MKSSFLPFSLALQSVVTTGLTPDIRADTNRDGIVDVEGSSDIGNKAFWSPERGAIFLPNIGDKHMRCLNKDGVGNPLSNDELAACNDASGHLLLAPEYVAPLRIMPLNVSEAATANIYVTPRAAYDRVRLFVLDDAKNSNSTTSWRLVDQEFSFNATQLSAGITLGIDGRALVTDASVWDGSVEVRFDVTDGQDRGTDAVALKMAPVLTHHHLQTVDTLVSTQGNSSDPVQQNFIRQLDQRRQDVGIEKPLLLFNQSSDIWAQDFIEPGYASMPGPNGPISIRVILRSAQSTRTGGRQVFEQLRGPGIGGFQPASGTGSGFGHREINSFGNLETIPPYTSKSGVQYKAGRIIMGKHFEKLPAKAMLDFLHGQQLQSPLLLQTGWLLIGHVDEFVQFLPYNNSLGFTISIADTRSGLELFQSLQTAGHGSVQGISFESNSTDVDEPGLGDTVDELLANSTFIGANAYAQRHIDENLETLLSEIPVAREDVVFVPTLYHDASFHLGATDDGLPPHTDDIMENERLTVGFHPSSINGIVTGRHYLSPKPFGPIVNGTDMLAQAVEKAYAKAGMDVRYVDDFLSHHVGAGEIHCGSNTLRQTNQVWWE
jgi:protein-arginine deiminase